MTDPRGRREEGSPGARDPQQPMGEHALDLHATFRDHHDFVWRSLAQLGLASTEVDDALQDVFVIAYRRRADFDGRTAVRGWLYGIARNVALKHRERTARGLARTAPVEAAATAASDDAVDLELARQEAAVLVERFLAVLDLDQRTVFVLAEIEGHSAPEIAAMVGSNLNTVYSRLRLARRRFARVLELRSEDARTGWDR